MNVASPTPSFDEGPWTTSLPELIALLDLDEVDGNAASDAEHVFEAQHAQAAPVIHHVFGGLVAAQAVAAATRTVAVDRPIHSMHSYFIRPGDPTVPILMHVEEVRDGRSFSHRRVSARQHGRAIMELSCSFAAPRPGLEHQIAAPTAPVSDDVRPDHEVIREIGETESPYGTNPDAFELRTVGMGPGWFRTPTPAEQQTLQWVRAAGDVPDSPALHAALFAFASDMRILHPGLRPHGRSTYDDDIIPATIDHSVWFHRSPRVDDWMLWAYDSPWAGDARAFCRASVFAGDGTMIASIAQEGLLRV